MVQFAPILAVVVAAVVWRPFPVQFARGVTGQTVVVRIDGRLTKTTFAGKLGFRDQSSSWQTVCAAVRSPISNGQFFAVKPRKSGQVGGNVKKAGNIVAQWFNAARTADQCAGLQLAVWEAIEDGGSHADFARGRFQADASAAALSFAEAYYEAIEQDGEALFLQSDNQGQDQITTVM